MKTVIIKNEETNTTYIFTKDSIFMSVLDGKNQIHTLEVEYEDLATEWERNQASYALQEVANHDFKLGVPFSQNLSMEDRAEIMLGTELGKNIANRMNDMYEEKDLHPYHRLDWPIIN